MKKLWYGMEDSFRGKLPTEEMIELTIIFAFYKLFDDINRNKENIDTSYPLVKYVEKIDIDRLRENPTYTEFQNQMEKILESFPSFHQIIKPLKNMDGVQVRDIVWKITDLLKAELSFGEDLVRARYMEIYEKIQLFFKSSTKNFMMFTTPDPVIEILDKILNVSSDETLMDPCFGIGTLAIKVGKNAKEIMGYEKNQQIFDFGKLLIETAGKVGEIKNWDSLEGNLRRGDVVVSHIPFSVKSTRKDYENRDYLHWGTPSRTNEDFSFISLIAAQLDKRGAVIVPEGALFRGGAEELIRKNLIEENLISGIISLPSGVFSPYAAIATSIIFFDRENKKDGVFILDGKEYFKKLVRFTSITDENSNKLVEDFKLRKEIPGISKLVTMEELSQNEYILNSNRYIETIRAVRDIGQIEKEMLESYQSALESRKICDKILETV